MTGVLADVLGLAGIALLVVAGLGANRLGDVFARLHAAAVGTTSGTVLVLVAGVLGVPSLRRLGTLTMAILVIVATVPTAAHLLARSVTRAADGREPEVLHRPAEPGPRDDAHRRSPGA